MNSRFGLGLAALSLVGVIGCQAAPATFRGQNPMPAGAAMAPQHGPTPGPIYYDGPREQGAQSCPPSHCHPNGAECPLCAPDNFWTPTHHHTFDYKQPKNLSYPPQNQPAGVVVYPYYTCKGPSDFFMK